MSEIDIDTLMARDPLDLSSQDIDAIIAFHRAQRARRAAGEKPTKPKATAAPEPVGSLTDLLKDKLTKPFTKIERRI